LRGCTDDNHQHNDSFATLADSFDETLDDFMTDSSAFQRGDRRRDRLARDQARRRTVLRVPAETEREKGEKALLALAFERRAA
jgi:hypothetical protein